MVSTRPSPLPNHGVAVTTILIFFVHLMKWRRKIETKHFEHTFAVLGGRIRAAEPLLTKQVEVLCVSPQALFHGFYRVMSVTFLFFLYSSADYSPDRYYGWLILRLVEIMDGF